MRIFQAIVSVLALSLSGAVWAGPIPENQESAVGLRSYDLPAEQTGSFEVSFDATPLADKIDCFTGISAATPRDAGDVAAIVRFSESGTIDVRNGGAFRADQNLGYSANKVYRVRMVIDIAKKTYSVFVTPPGQPEVPLAKNYAFRSTQSGVQSLGKIVLAGYSSRGGDFKGSHRVAGVSVKAASTP
jgi:unsaturated chondroitin disaccharide hydrolase